MKPGFKPMLGETANDMGLLRYPLLASPKLDGIRAIWWNGQFYSRNLKPIPNAAISAKGRTAKHLQNGWEGELTAGTFNTTSSVVMTRDGSAEGVTFSVFDDSSQPDKTFLERIEKIRNLSGWVRAVPQYSCDNVIQAEKFEEQFLSEGHEGMILRSPFATYKYGRSTLREQGLLKVKRFLDGEAEVVDFVEEMHNANPATKDALGYTDRTSHKANMIPKGTLGTLMVAWEGGILGIGSGFTAHERKVIWENQPHYRGKLAKFKYLPTTKDLPRHPVFLGWRNMEDM